MLITAGTSTTGLAVIAMSNKIGATIIATTRTSKKSNLLLEASADYVIATEEEDLVIRVMEITNGSGADVMVYLRIMMAIADNDAMRSQSNKVIY